MGYVQFLGGTGVFSERGTINLTIAPEVVRSRATSLEAAGWQL